jgi:glycosyltransferase involved in cell wall biosynthesis
MLMDELGFRKPRADEEARILAERADSGNAPLPDFSIPAAVLSAEPLISYSSIRPQHAPLGVASLLPATGHPAWFLISPIWSVEANDADRLRALSVIHRIANPLCNLIFICNAPSEVRLLQERGEAAFFYNKTANTSERVFMPLEKVRLEFDAIYNAQLLPWKRHELSLDIERCAFLFYRDGSRLDAAEAEAAIRARHAAAAPGHVFINPLDRNGVPVRYSPRKVNRHLNRASVGLCLSAKEGAMFASAEYLLAGLPIVSTPSLGGRDVFYDEEYCRIAAPDPRSVAEAVKALQVLAMPRSYVRDRTLRRLEQDRKRFLTLIDNILEESGSARRMTMPWPFKKPVTMEWMRSAEASRRARNGIVDGFEKKKGFLHRPGWLRRLFPQH